LAHGLQPIGCTQLSEIQMSLSRVPAWLAFVSAALATAAPAQTEKPATASNYRSVFDGYQRYRDEPLLPWRQANDTVGRIGGWQAYAREAQGASTPASAASSPAPAAPAHDHGGHKSP
jgi:hypothetical protein